MTRQVHCVVDGIDTDGLDFPPWPGELGRRVFDSVGKPAWQRWLAHQTMLINENRINPLDPKARAFIAGEMEKYFFGAGSAAPPGFVPPADAH